MITRAQYNVLCAIPPLVVKVKRGKYDWPEYATEAAVLALVQAGAFKIKVEGELGDYTITYTPTEKARALKLAYEGHSKAERKQRGR